MKRILLGAAVVVAAVALAWWWGAGAHPGWTKTSVVQKTLDEVTGLEAVTYEKKFVPGLDFLGAGLMGAAFLAGGALLVGRRASGPAASGAGR